ncbi:MAG TPA: hypothetical protein VI819_00055 [Patescibacteria group bacterium]|nr:hypothetical protein [Patescibacteria group bacterium]
MDEVNTDLIENTTTVETPGDLRTRAKEVFIEKIGKLDGLTGSIKTEIQKTLDLANEGEGDFFTRLGQAAHARLTAEIGVLASSNLDPMLVGITGTDGARVLGINTADISDQGLQKFASEHPWALIGGLGLSALGGLVYGKKGIVGGFVVGGVVGEALGTIPGKMLEQYTK